MTRYRSSKYRNNQYDYQPLRPIVTDGFSPNGSPTGYDQYTSNRQAQQARDYSRQRMGNSAYAPGTDPMDEYYSGAQGGNSYGGGQTDSPTLLERDYVDRAEWMSSAGAPTIAGQHVYGDEFEAFSDPNMVHNLRPSEPYYEQESYDDYSGHTGPQNQNQNSNSNSNSNASRPPQGANRGQQQHNAF